MRVQLRKFGEGSSHARFGERVPARLEFHAAHLQKAADSPGEPALFASMEGELELRGPGRQPVFINRVEGASPDRIQYIEDYLPEVREHNRDTPRRKSIKLEFDSASFEEMLDAKGGNSHLILPEEPEGALYLELDTRLIVADKPEADLGECDRLDVLLKGIVGNPVPPTSIALKVFSDDGRVPADIAFELNDIEGNVHEGVVNELGEAAVDGLAPGGCTVVLRDVAPSEWGAQPKAGSSPTVYTSAGEEDLPMIAARNGFQSWRTIYDLPENAGLREQRPSPNHLARGDEIQLPPKDSEPVPVETGQLHLFRVDPQPAEMLRLRIDSDAAFVYELTVAGMTLRGEGEPGDVIEHQVPPEAPAAELVIYEKGAERESGDKYELKLGALEPPSTDRGLQARLCNLGFDPKGVDGKIGANTRNALEQFQLAHGLEATREGDEATRSLLEREHDQPDAAQEP